MTMRITSAAAAVAVAMFAIVPSVLADPADKPADVAGAAAPALPPKEAGARYGQALGCVEICVGSKITDKAKTMNAAYTGADLAAFTAQAEKIYDSWLKVKSCANQNDPNQCKVIMDRSCLAAEAEIGATGAAIPGLVEFPAHQ